MSNRRGKKGKAAWQDDDEEFALPTENDVAHDAADASNAPAFTGKKKGGNINATQFLAVLDDANVGSSLGNESHSRMDHIVGTSDDSQSVKEDQDVSAGKKKSKRGKKQDNISNVADFGEESTRSLGNDSQSYEEEQVQFTGKKKVKKGKKQTSEDADNESEFASEVVNDSQSFENENNQFVSKKKGKKGKQQLEDVDFEVTSFDSNDHEAKDDDADENEVVITFSGKKKTKSNKLNQSFLLLDHDEDRGAALSHLDEYTSEVSQINDQLPSAAEEKQEASLLVGKKNDKKVKKQGEVLEGTDIGEDSSAVKAKENDDDDNLEIDDIHIFTGKKKGKCKSVTKPFSFPDMDSDAIVDDLGDGAAAEQVEETLPRTDTDNLTLATIGEDGVVQFSGKKKAKKGKKPSKISDDADVTAIMAELNSEPNGPTVIDVPSEDASRSQLEGTIPEADISDPKLLMLGDHELVQFSGKKKGKKSQKVADNVDIKSVSAELGSLPNETMFIKDNNCNILPNLELSEASKKKGKSKKSGRSVQEEEDLDAILAELDGPKVKQPEITKTAEQTSLAENVQSESTATAAAGNILERVEASKKKDKSKKGGRTIQEEEDLDAILAELDGPKLVKQPVEQTEGMVETVQPEPIAPRVEVNDLDGIEGEESAAAKKKKKKKEKEKAKASASGRPGDQVDADVSVTEKQDAVKSKAGEKKVPKHVREMQERLARQREAEERLKREEEERRQKEEEEQRRLEEVEREREEAKRRRKEREKEKLLKKKQEGKLLTGKQKEEARRLALMREQLLAQKGISSDSDVVVKEEAGHKKPKYDSRKKRRPQGGEAASLVEQSVEENEIQSTEESKMEIEPALTEDCKGEEAAVVLEEEEDDDEDWDAKQWDDDKIGLPGLKSTFAEEEETILSSKHVVKQSVTQSLEDLLAPSKVAVQKPVEPHANNKATNKPQNDIQESEDETESEDMTDSDEEDATTKRRKEAALKREARKAEALAKRSADDLRSPICCILGHVDTGKTKLLDCIRRTNVQEGEAGGITQQIGATYFPMENIKERTKELKSDTAEKVPGLLVIDTPGHESFTNLRSRGSGLCDIAILVIDIMHGLEPQTLESLNLLKMRHTPFVVALNKIDRLYGWKTIHNAPIRVALKQQSKDVVNEFEMRLGQIITELKEQGLNSELYYKNKEIRKVVSIVPTSAISGEGVPDLLMLLVHLTQKVMEDKLMYVSEVQCTVLELKVIEGLGTTVDVILVNGVLHEGDQIVVCGMQGPIVTTIRALLTPHPMKELRVKGSYQHHKELKAAQGIKITAQGLEHAIAGTQLYVVGPDDDLAEVKEEAMQDMKNVMSRVDKSGEGVCVQASTLGSLEALLEFLKSPAVKIPVSGINIGPVHKRDVMRASVMLERKKKEYATILAFDVKVTPEAKELAEELGVRVFMADIIYHLFDQFTAYMNNVKEEKRKEVAEEAVFPCVLGIKPQYIFNKKDPIILGVDVLEGIAKVGTPLCVPSKDMIVIGRIASMEVNHKVVDLARKGQAVAMKIVGSTPEETQKMYGRHFDHEDELVSHMTRRSIDVLKESFRDELSVEEWKLVVKLKRLFNIP